MPFGTTTTIDAPLRVARQGENMNSGREDWESIVRTHTPLAFDAAWRCWAMRPIPKTLCRRRSWMPFGCTPGNRWITGRALMRHLATRRAIDRLRKRRAAAFVPLGTFEVTGPESEQPESVAAERELADRLRWAVVGTSRSRGECLLAPLLRRDGQQRDRPDAGHQHGCGGCGSS